MKKMVVMLMTACVATGAFAKPMKFNDKFKANQDKMLKKLIRAKTKPFQKYDMKKVAIVECTAEFLQSKEVTAGAFGQRAAAMGAQNLAIATGTPQYARIMTSTSTITFDDGYYAYTADQLFEMAAAIFRENGIEVIPRHVVAANEKYRALNLKSDKETRGFKGSIMGNNVTTSGVKLSATDLGIYPTNPLKAIKLAVQIAEMTAEMGADSVARVHFYIDKGKNGAPVLSKYEILLSAGLKGEKRGFKGKEKMVYEFKYTSGDVPVMSIKNALASTADIAGESKGEVDIVKYHSALLELVNVVTDAFKEAVAADIAKKKA